FSYVAAPLIVIPYFFFFVLSSFDAMSSNRGKMVPGSDDQFVIVWNKQTLHFESEQGKKLFSTESFLKRLFRSSNQSPETLCKLTVSCSDENITNLLDKGSRWDVNLPKSSMEP
ncbi:unnamed protein product, partial [Brassica oleracea]